MKNHRSSNFTSAEVDLLLESVKAHKEKVEWRGTDQMSVELKEEVWKKIESEFNASSLGTYRCKRSLRTKYENIKKVAKRNLAMGRQNWLTARSGNMLKQKLNLEIEQLKLMNNKLNLETEHLKIMNNLEQAKIKLEIEKLKNEI